MLEFIGALDRSFFNFYTSGKVPRYRIYYSLDTILSPSDCFIFNVEITFAG